MISQAFDTGLSVSSALQGHHRHLDDMLDRVEMAVEVGNWGESRRRFAVFRKDLEEHMRLEEELMFPSLEAATGSRRGPIPVMRAEHAEIIFALSAIELLIAEEQPVAEPLADLEARLAAHHLKEESVLYPMFERMAPQEAYAALAAEVTPLEGMFD
jgi:iron-sulfur cluster repair protein YtfE (RIC family)